jgi:hypothetical protein
MKTFFIIIGIIIFVIILGVFFKYHPTNNATFTQLFPNNALRTSSQAQANINGQTIHLLIAKSETDQHKGLSDRASLPQDTGMLFIFSRPDYYLFWMRHMKFPLDIIYINNNKIVTILNNVKNPPYSMENPPLLRPLAPANKVLELNAGSAKKYNVKVGDTIQISNI